MANAFENPDTFAKETIRQLFNRLGAVRSVYRGYGNEWKSKQNGWSKGDTIAAQMPVYFRVKSGASADVVDLYERTQDLTMDQRHHVAWNLSAQEMTLDLDKYSKRYIGPAMETLANYIDVQLLGMYTDVPNQVGTPGTTPNQYSVFADARTRLEEEACPAGNRYLYIKPKTTAKMTDHLKALSHEQIVGGVVRKGRLSSPFAGFDEVFESNNLPTHTNGTWASGLTLQADGTSSEGDTTLAIKSGGTSETALHGDIFTVATVNSINPISGLSTGNLRQFVVDANASMDGSGEIAALTCTPGTAPHAIYSGSASEAYLPYQTVNAVPANNDVITVAGTTGQEYDINLAFHRDAFAFISVPLTVPASAVWKAQATYKGISIRIIRGYAVGTDIETIRFDVLWGKKTINPFLATRIAG